MGEKWVKRDKMRFDEGLFPVYCPESMKDDEYPLRFFYADSPHGEFICDRLNALAEKDAEIARMTDGLEKIMFLKPCRGDCQSDGCPAGIAQVTLGRSPQSKDPCCDDWDREKKLIASQTENKRLRAALEYYANHDSYKMLCGDSYSCIDYDKGSRARDALKGGKE